jgi:hypothetical protein
MHMLMLIMMVRVTNGVTRALHHLVIIITCHPQNIRSNASSIPFTVIIFIEGFF